MLKRIGFFMILFTLLVACGTGSPTETDTSSELTPNVWKGDEVNPPGAYPWIAMLRHDSIAGDGFLCGGSLIHESWVLTAAHCFDDRDRDGYTIVLGQHRKNARDGTEQYFDVDPNDIEIHPLYNSDLTGLDNDIALMRLNRPASLNSKVNTVRLAAARPPVGTDMKIIGWGKTRALISSSKVLREGDLPMVAQADGAGEFSVQPVTDNMLFAGFEDNSSGGCSGDSGGPLFRGDVQVGITSFSKASCRSYTAFTDVSRYRNWISNFAPPTLTVTNKTNNNVWHNAGPLTWSGDGPGNANGTARYGSTVTIGGYFRDGVWLGCDDTFGRSNNRHYCTVTLHGPRAVTFQPTSYALTVRVSGSMTARGLGINCTESGGDCAENFRFGFQTAVSHNSGSSAMWSGCDSVVGSTCNVTMNSNRIVSVRRK